jgi:DNA-binding NarL/FixJ family response regulator
VSKILPPPWDHYLALQTKLKVSTIVDGTSWGFEAALNRILASDSVSSSEEIERAARSESRRERHRARLRRQNLPSEDYIDGENVVQARQHLRIVRERVTDEEWTLLSDIGEGGSYDEIAAVASTSSGALRVRIQRLRQRICGALAA